MTSRKVQTGCAAKLNWLAVRSVLALGLMVCDQDSAEAQRPRVDPPDWSKLGPGPFFENALTEGLNGPRPVRNLATAPTKTSTSAPSITGSPEISNAAVPTGAPSTGWSNWISRDTLENEIKAIKLACDTALKNEGDFKAQGYRDVRRHMSCAATLFAMIHQYDGDVRWKTSAVSISQKLAHVALNAKVGSAAVFREAVACQRDLSDLVSGAQISSASTALPDDWTEISDRQLLMQRLEIAVQQELAAAVASPNDFSRSIDKLIHEGELTAALGQTLEQSGMEDADSPEYTRWCDELKSVGQAMARAARDNNYDAAREAHSGLKKSCVNCHAQYRG